MFENVTAARSARGRRPGPRGTRRRPRTRSTGALRQLFAVAEAYPDLKASQNFLELQDEITDTEDKIQASRRFYNMTVRDLNVKVERFLRASSPYGNFHKRGFFELDDRRSARCRPFPSRRRRRRRPPAVRHA